MAALGAAATAAAAPAARGPLAAAAAGAAVAAPAAAWLAARWLARHEPGLAVGGPPRAALAAAYAVLAWRVGPGADLAAVLLTATGVAAIALVDRRARRIPTALVAATAVAAAAALALGAGDPGAPAVVAGGCAGAAAFAGLLAAVRRATRGGLGVGDVRLGALLGLTLGAVAATAADPVVSGLLASWGAAVVGAGVAAAGHVAAGLPSDGAGARPFAPALAAGWLVVLVVIGQS
jgi:leader peptidase (prepilin peptidase)/N-methyltransferase